MIVANTEYKVVIAATHDLGDDLQVSYDEREARVSIRKRDPMFSILLLTVDECHELQTLLAEVLEAIK